MKKISQKDILQTILKEALTIKRKREIFNEARKMNLELKQLNEDRWQGLGHGFASYDGPSPIMGLQTQSNYEEVKPEEDCDCKLDQFPGLEKDMEEMGNNEETTFENEEDNIESLKAKNAELEDKLAQIQNALGALNEGFWDKAKAGFQGIKAGIGAGIQAGKQAGQQQYQQTQQSQEIKAKLDRVKAELNQAKANALQKGEIDYHAIQKILAQAGYKYSGKGAQALQPLSEGEACGEATALEEAFGGFLKGAANKIKGDISGVAQNVGNKISGAVQNVANKASQYASDVKAAGQQSSAQQDQNTADKAEFQAKEQERLASIGSEYDKIINLINQL